jgi:hypothetical protein
MNKKKLLALTLSSLFLCSCGSTEYAATPSGKKMTNEEGKAKMQAAMQVSDTQVATDNGKIKVGIEDGYLKANANTSTNASTYTSQSTIDIDISKIKLLLSAEGINSEDAKDYYSHMEFSFHGGMKASSNVAGINQSREIETKNYDFDVYQDYQCMYFDFSSTDSLNLVKALLPSLDLNNGKLKVNTSKYNVDENGTLNQTTPSDNINFKFENLVETSEDGVYLDLGNGNYAFTYSMDKDTLTAKLNASYTTSNVNYTLSDETVVKYTVLFSETGGLTSIGFDVKLNGSFTDGYTGTDSSSSASILNYSNSADFTISAGTKLTFDTSSSITVDKVTDTSEYKYLYENDKIN